MRFCTNCNQVLQDSDIVCPHCAGDRAGNTDTGTAPPVMPAHKKLNSLHAQPEQDPAEVPDFMRIAATVRTARQAGDRSWDSGAARRAATNSFTIEIPLNQVISETLAPDESEQFGEIAEAPAENVTGATPQSQEAEDFNFKGEADMSDDTGAIERALVEDEVIEQAITKKSGPGKLEITLILILAAAVIVFGVLIAVKLFSAKQPATEDYTFEQFVGTWISDYFYFGDGSQASEPIYCEQLIIRADGTFTRRYLVVNRSIPEGYLTDEWAIEEEIFGTVQFFEDSRTLALIWEDELTIFDRYILKLDDTHMTLREYYDEAQLDFFDMKFIRI